MDEQGGWMSHSTLTSISPSCYFVGINVSQISFITQLGSPTIRVSVLALACLQSLGPATVCRQTRPERLLFLLFDKDQCMQISAFLSIFIYSKTWITLINEAPVTNWSLISGFLLLPSSSGVFWTSASFHQHWIHPGHSVKTPLTWLTFTPPNLGTDHQSL